MVILFLTLLFSIASELYAMTTTSVQKRPQPPTVAEQMQAILRDSVIQLTDTEYRQLIQLPSLDRIIAPNRTVKAADLFTILLSKYQLSRPKIYCIRAPCPQPALIAISNDSINIEIPLTESDFSEIIKDLNIP